MSFAYKCVLVAIGWFCHRHFERLPHHFEAIIIACLSFQGYVDTKFSEWTNKGQQDDFEELVNQPISTSLSFVLN